MIEKMAYVSIMGPKGEFNRITDEYLSRYEMQLESSFSNGEAAGSLMPFTEKNPYKEPFEMAKTLCASFDKNPKEKSKAAKQISGSEAQALVEELSESLKEFDAKIDSCEKKAKAVKDKLAGVSPFEGIDYDLKEIFAFEHIAYRFGRLPKEEYNACRQEISAGGNSYFIEGSSDEKYVWGVYFAPEAACGKADAIFASLHFERIHISHEYSGTPKAIAADLSAQLKDLEETVKGVRDEREALLSSKRDDLFAARDKLDDLNANFEAHNYAALAGDGEIFILSAWMCLKDADLLAGEIKSGESDIDIIINKKPLDAGLNPPTKIKNKGPLKPYEMYTKMYGLPAYGEFDPTWLVGISYSFIFGVMFGDLGQGLVLMLGGAALYFFKKSHPKLPGIIACAGFFSAIFGILYGSFFGFEDLIPALWLKPKEAMVTLNFIGRINTVFAIAIAFGMFLTLFLMLLNVYNGFRQKDFSNCLFGSNGIAGFVFYGFIVLIVLLYMTGHKLPATVIIVLMVVIPLIVIGLNEPLVNLMNKKKPIEGGIGMFCLETFFDLFEICLSFFSNTLSFVRIGAFAVSHAAMMEVVLQLTGYENGNGSIIGLIFGNLVVIGFEGLIVGIQVLRLEYYEIFSKFYKGTGREFKPFFKRRAV